MEAASQRGRASTGAGALSAIITIALGAGVLIGLSGAFVGIGTSSFWMDELFTAWVIGTDGDASAMTARALTDIHPPLFYYKLFAYSLVFGDSDAALRSFSAIAAVASIVVFYVGAASAFSRNGRLFAAVLATGSEYWFFHAQNARSNALSLLIAAVIFSLCLSLLRDSTSAHRRRVKIGALAITVFIGAFTHYYLAYVALAALLVLALLTSRSRVVFLSLAAALALSVFAYLKIMVEPNAQWLLDNSWIQNDPAWYAGELLIARRHTFDLFALGALSTCFALLLFHLGRDKSLTVPRVLTAPPALVLSVATPVVLLGGAAVSSILLSPNFTARNFLLVSPFIWGAVAALYDGAFQRTPSRITAFVNALAAIAALATCVVVQARAYPHMPPYRETGAWIEAQAACARQPIPIWRDRRRYGAETSKPGFVERLIPGTRSRYAPQVELVLGRLDRPAPDVVRNILRQRLDGTDQCPILGWSADVTAFARRAEIAAYLAHEGGADPEADPVELKFFPEFGFRRYSAPEQLDRGLWVAFVAPPREPEASP